jgi:hypothetical protein
MPDSMTPTLAAIHDCEARLTAAERRGNETALRELLAEDFAGITARSVRVDREGFIRGLCHPELRFNQLAIEDVAVSIHASMARVLGRTTFAGVFRGQAFAGTSQYLDLWEQRAGRWILLSSAVCPERS